MKLRSLEVAQSSLRLSKRFLTIRLMHSSVSFDFLKIASRIFRRLYLRTGRSGTAERIGPNAF